MSLTRYVKADYCRLPTGPETGDITWRRVAPASREKAPPRSPARARSPATAYGLRRR